MDPHVGKRYIGWPRSSTMEVRFGPQLTVEETGLRLTGATSRQVRSTRIDLSSCTTLDIVALLHLVAVTARRSSDGLSTRFRLPHDLAARSYLRKKGFGRAIETVTRIPFRLLVDGEWFHGPRAQDPPRPFDDAQSAILAYLNDHQFFWFEHYDVDNDNDRGPIISREGRRWQDPLVVELLKTRLSGSYALDVSRVVVREMLSNLLASMPGHGYVMCVSHIDGKKPPGSRPQLTIAAWQSSLAKPEDSFELPDRILAAIDQPGRREGFVIKIQESISRHRRELDAAPSIDRTSTEVQVDHDIDSQASAALPRTHEGQSFEALYRYVIDEFGGEIDLWSKSKIARVSKGAIGGVPYRVNVTYAIDALDTGSIIAVRLPLHHD